MCFTTGNTFSCTDKKKQKICFRDSNIANKKILADLDFKKSSDTARTSGPFGEHVTLCVLSRPIFTHDQRILLRYMIFVQLCDTKIGSKTTECKITLICPFKKDTTVSQGTHFCVTSITCGTKNLMNSVSNCKRFFKLLFLLSDRRVMIYHARINCDINLWRFESMK